MTDADFVAPRQYLLHPIPQLFEAAQLLHEAADAHLACQFAKAEALIRAADVAPIFEWSETLFMGKSIPKEIKDDVRRLRADPDKPKPVAKEARASGALTASLKRKVTGEWIGFYNTERPHSALAGQTPAEAHGAGHPVDMMDKPNGLPTSPQAQQQQQDVIDRILAA